MRYEQHEPFSVCFNTMKIPYRTMNQIFDHLRVIKPNDSINVFINIECIMHNLSMIHDLDKKIITEKNFNVIIASNIINIAGHYKRFFRDNKLPTNVYLYMTDLDSEDFREYEWNDEYRSYYLNKYNNNPKYVDMSRALKDVIIPEVKTICEYLPNIHFIQVKNLDGVVIPYVIADENKNFYNVLITNDLYDTQYYGLDRFTVLYTKRTQSNNALAYSIQGYLKELLKREVESSECDISDMLYTTILSFMGDRSKSIESIRRYGALTVMKIIMKGISDNQISNQLKSIDMIYSLFPDDIAEDLKVNYHQYSIEQKFLRISDNDKFNIKNQIVNRFDNNSLLEIQKTRYYDYPLMLEEVTM